MSANGLAWFALGAWPAVVLAAMASPRARARLAYVTSWVMLLPVMFLPSALSLKVQGVPALDKHRLTFLAIAIGLQLFHRRRIVATSRGAWFGRVLFVVQMAGVAGTVLTNGDTLTFGPTILPGLSSYDILSVAGALFLDLYLPFAIGQRIFQTEEDLRDLFRVLVWCTLVYLPLAALEVRLSPQFHRWVYGYHQHQFIEMRRGDGFRPMLFMTHGLNVALFAAMGFIAALGLKRVGDRSRPGPWVRLASPVALLALCRSMASILYSLLGLVLEPLLRRRAGAWALVLIATLVVCYPASRASGLFPSKELVDAAAWVSEARAQSLDFRFRNEELLIARAMQRPLFGWGTFGRNRVFASWGRDLTITDGQWIIVLGTFGLVGLAGLLTFMLAPLLRYCWRRQRMQPAARSLAGQLAVMVTIWTVDLLPNAWGDALPLACAGALFTLAGRLAEPHAARRVAAVPLGRTWRTPRLASPPDGRMAPGPDPQEGAREPPDGPSTPG